MVCHSDPDPELAEGEGEESPHFALALAFVFAHHLPLTTYHCFTHSSAPNCWQSAPAPAAAACRGACIPAVSLPTPGGPETPWSRCCPELRGCAGRTASPPTPPPAHSAPSAPLPSASGSVPPPRAVAPACRPTSAPVGSCPSLPGTAQPRSARRSQIGRAHV